MRVERTYLVRVVQVYEGEPPPEWDMDDIAAENGELWPSQDEHVCNNWELIEDTLQLLDNDDLTTRIAE